MACPSCPETPRAPMYWVLNDGPACASCGASSNHKWVRAAVCGVLAVVACSSFVPHEVSHGAIVAYVALLHLALLRAGDRRAREARSATGGPA